MGTDGWRRCGAGIAGALRRAVFLSYLPFSAAGAGTFAAEPFPFYGTAAALSGLPLSFWPCRHGLLQGRGDVPVVEAAAERVHGRTEYVSAVCRYVFDDASRNDDTVILGDPVRHVAQVGTRDRKSVV